MENRGGCNFYYYVIILLKSRVELGGKYFLESTLTSKIFGINHELEGKYFWNHFLIFWNQPPTIIRGNISWNQPQIFWNQPLKNILESTPKNYFGSIITC